LATSRDVEVEKKEHNLLMTELTELTGILKESSLRISEAVSEQNQSK